MSEICPNDFFDGAPARAIGTECEYWVQPMDSAPRADEQAAKRALSVYLENFLEPDNVAQATGRPTTIRNNSGIWLANGAKIYGDMGVVLEYCTPEALGPLNAAASDIEGQFLMQRITHQTPDTRTRGGLFRRTGTIAFEGNVTKDRKTETGYITSGYHQNLITPSRSAEESHHTADKLATYTVTRLFAWGGMVGINSFKPSQKATGIGRPFNDRKYLATTEGGKPLGRILNSPYGWSRIEIRHADATQSPWSMFMNLATASLTLRLTEHAPRYPQICGSLPVLSDAVDDIKVINSLEGLYQQLRTKNDEYLTAVDIQERYALAAQALSERVKLPSDELVAIDEWLKVCRDLKAVQSGEASYHILADRVEWAARRAYLEQNIGSLATLNSRNFSAIQADILWDHCNPVGQSALHWGRHQTSLTKQLGSLISSQQISLTPRARSRGEFISQLSERSDVTIDGWDNLMLNKDNPGQWLIAVSPYDQFSYKQL